MSHKTLTYIGVVLIVAFVAAILARPFLFGTDEPMTEDVPPADVMVQ